MKSKLFRFTVVLFLLLNFTCSKDKSPTEPKEPPIDLESRIGTLQIPEGSTVTAKDLEVLSFAQKANVSNDGKFKVNATKAEKFQVLLFNEKTTNKPVYLGLYNPTLKKVTANDTSTALALTLFNPLLIYSKQSDREIYLEAVKQNQKFSQLLELLRTAYKTNAQTALDYNTNPLVYQTAVELMKETMEGLGGNKGFKGLRKETSNPPYIEDKPGDDIVFMNPTHVWYAAGIYKRDNSLIGLETISRVEKILSFNFGLPPVVVSEPEPTVYPLGDGDFRIYLAKGFDFTKFTQWDDPMGRATILNSGQTILYIIEIVIGNFFDVNLLTLPNYFHVSLDRGYQLSKDVATGDVAGFLEHFLSLIADNSEELAYWIFQEYQSNAAHQFINTCATIIGKVTKVLEIIGYANEQGPFVWDIIFAPKDITYLVTQINGIIQSTKSTVTDIDGNVYKTVKIGNQWWMAENLKVTRYRNGDPIPNVTDYSQWMNLTTGAQCAYGNKPANADIYGLLYNWYAVSDSRNIAPAGWHVPTDEEWKQLEMALGMSRSQADGTGRRGTNEGSKLAGNASLWQDGDLENNSAFGTSGLSALPGGCRFHNDGHFYNMRVRAYFWSSTENSSNTALFRTLFYGETDVSRNDYGKGTGFSVRCVKD